MSLKLPRTKYVERAVTTVEQTWAGNTVSDILGGKFDALDTSKKYRLSWSFDVENKTAAVQNFQLWLRHGTSQATALTGTIKVLQSVLSDATSGGVWGFSGSFIWTPANITAVITFKSTGTAQIDPQGAGVSCIITLEEINDEIVSTTQWN